MSIFNQLSDFVSKSFLLLDEESIGEIRQFVVSTQNGDGGFADRGGRSDLYYSFFAHLILKSFSFSEYKPALIQFVKDKAAENEMSFVDQCCIAILKKDLLQSRFSGMKYLMRALKKSARDRYEGEASYRYFMLLLALDVYGFNTLLTRFLARRFYAGRNLDYNWPCPVLVAHLILKQQLGNNVQPECNLLMSYFDGKAGFHVFAEKGEADLLSTAVALFALKTSGSDLALLAPACMRFVDDNFRNGAFLPGNGEQVKDLEYTFYGLLALGVLA